MAKSGTNRGIVATNVNITTAAFGDNSTAKTKVTNQGSAEEIKSALNQLQEEIAAINVTGVARNQLEGAMEEVKTCEAKGSKKDVGHALNSLVSLVKGLGDTVGSIEKIVTASDKLLSLMS